MLQISAEQVAAVLSLTPVPHSFAELDDRVANGLPKSALRSSIARICSGAESRKLLTYRVIPEATYKRRRDTLSVEESQRTERLARVFATAVHVWGNEVDAQEFLAKPHAMLSGRPPIDVALSELGARRVEEVLWGLYFGAAA